MRVVWTDAAVRDVEKHVAYLDQFNRVAARELAMTLFTTGDSLSAFPNRGRPGRVQGSRELVCVSPYVIFYRVRPDQVVIQRVLHGKLLA